MDNYELVLKLVVFSYNDLCNEVGNDNTAQSIIKRLLAKKLIKRVKYNLYCVCDINTKNVIADPYIIASKINENSYISYHSALDYYGTRNQVFYTINVSNEKGFKNFEFEGYEYLSVKSKYNFGVVNNELMKIKVTDRERTFIDCIDKTNLAGGHEEMISCIELLGKLDEKNLLNYLEKYNSRKLYAKVGYILELLNYIFGVSNQAIAKIKEKANNQIYYFDKDTKRVENKFIKEWNLIVPISLTFPKEGRLF